MRFSLSRDFSFRTRCSGARLLLKLLTWKCPCAHASLPFLTPGGAPFSLIANFPPEGLTFKLCLLGCGPNCWPGKENWIWLFVCQSWVAIAGWECCWRISFGSGLFFMIFLEFYSTEALLFMNRALRFELSYVCFRSWVVNKNKLSKFNQLLFIWSLNLIRFIQYGSFFHSNLEIYHIDYLLR
jgi:hypothetical protein